VSFTWPAGTRDTKRVTLYDLTLASGDVLRVQVQEVVRDGSVLERKVIVRVGKGQDVELVDATQVTDLAAALTAAAAVFS
jgi:hypothetical protein